ncbi:sugar kinase [Candidatus Hodarchaeum mangrovi]
MDLISIGECMIEFYSEPQLGENIYIQGFGGDTLNVLVAAARLGTSVAFLTKVGDDQFSQYLLKSWEQENINTSLIKQVKDSFSGIYFINLDEKKERSFVYYRKGSAASKLQPIDIDFSLISNCKILYTSGITQALSKSNRETIKQVFEEFKKKNPKKIIAYDPNFREKLWFDQPNEAQKAQKELLPFIDLVLPSYPADAILSQSISSQEMIDYYTINNIKTVIIKLGEEGCLYTLNQGKSIQHSSALKVSQIVDTTGAGDAFNGGVLSGILKGYSIPDAIKLGTIVAGLKIQGKGAINPLPRLDEVTKFW